jgi:hypothetical protein
VAAAPSSPDGFDAILVCPVDKAALFHQPAQGTHPGAYLCTQCGRRYGFDAQAGPVPGSPNFVIEDASAPSAPRAAIARHLRQQEGQAPPVPTAPETKPRRRAVQAAALSHQAAPLAVQEERAAASQVRRALQHQGHTLVELEAVIARGLDTFVEVGAALAEIRERQLYRHQGFDRFEDYCRDRWQLGRSRAYQLMDASQVVSLMSTIVDTDGVPLPPPANEAQARELVPVLKQQGDAAAEATWREVTDQAAERGSPPTAAQIREVVAARLDPPGRPLRRRSELAPGSYEILTANLPPPCAAGDCPCAEPILDDYDGREIERMACTDMARLTRLRDEARARLDAADAADAAERRRRGREAAAVDAIEATVDRLREDPRERSRALAVIGAGLLTWCAADGEGAAVDWAIGHHARRGPREADEARALRSEQAGYAFPGRMTCGRLAALPPLALLRLLLEVVLRRDLGAALESGEWPPQLAGWYVDGAQW